MGWAGGRNHPSTEQLLNQNEMAHFPTLQGDTEEFAKPPVDSDLGCSVILPGQKVATVGAHQLQELLEIQGNGTFIPTR